MQSNEKATSILLNYNCKYSHFVLAYYNAAFSCHFFRDSSIYKNLSYPFIISGDLKRKGTKFVLRRPDLGVLVFYEILDSTISDYYSRFKFHIYKTNPETFSYIHLVEVRYINENQCDIRSSLVFDNKIFLSQKEIQETLRIKYMIYKQFEISLRNYAIPKLAIAYTFINNKIELIWDILLNMKMIHKYVCLFAKSINYKGNIIKKNDIIELFDYKDKKNLEIIKYNVKVNRCNLKSKDLMKEGIIELLFEKNKMVNNLPYMKTRIILRIYEYEGKCTIYLLYYFLYNQNMNFLANFTNKKIKDLEIFKNIIEQYRLII